MDFIPSVGKLKNYGFALVGLAVTAYALTRLAPGVAAFVGLRPGGAALPTRNVLTLPNVDELLGRPQARTNFVELNPPAPSFSVFEVPGRNNIMDTILA